MIGKAISHYKILEKLGEGAMGVVYKGEDTKLDREVALKFLSPNALGTEKERARFVHEAKAAAALNHPNICTVYEIDESDGTVFMAMEYVDGESLSDRIESGPVGIDEAVRIASEIAEGLGEAHAKGIVHRDIKPDNVMITSRGGAKIMDFGLARLSGASRLTKAGTTLGTILYMSPEQARGEGVDHRTDIWSLGVVIYEMLTGRVPFRGDYDQAVVYSILNESPEPVSAARPDVPPLLARVVEKMLAKDPTSRHADAEEFLRDLRGLQSGTAAAREVSPSAPTIAVMPFSDMSPEKDQEYFCDGVAEEIINALTAVSGLRVIARTSAFAFRDEKEDIREVGRKLGAGTVLEGSVRKAGNTLRVTAQLVDATDGCHIWSERYDRELKDVFAIQDEIAAAIAQKLRIELTPQEEKRLATPRRGDPEAHEHYLRGLHYWSMRWKLIWKRADYAREAIAHFERAIEKDPTYAVAYAALAQLRSGLCRWISREGNCEEARAAAERALELDDTLAEAHTAMASVYLNADLDWSAAKEEHRRAIALNPGSASAHREYGAYLAWEGSYDKAIAEISLARDLDPLDYSTNLWLAFGYQVARRHREASEHFGELTRLFPDDKQAEIELAASRVYEQTDLEDAMAALKELAPNDIRLAVGHAWLGQRDEALRILKWWKTQEMEDVVYRVARVHAALGEKDEAFAWLEKTFETKPHALLQINSDPELDWLRADQRFEDLVRRAGIPSGQLAELERQAAP
jgi:TolB-like protein/Tfp pilus assembly protein PilF/predicted Ser/Thr protein kinase